MEEPATVPTVRSHVLPEDLARACSVVGALREETDFVVVLVHWGGGLSEGLAEYQRPLAHALLDAGADIDRRLAPAPRARRRALRRQGDPLQRRHAGRPDRPSTVAEELAGHLRDCISPDSFIATLDVAPDGGYSMRLTPATIDDGGVPVLA